MKAIEIIIISEGESNQIMRYLEILTLSSIYTQIHHHQICFTRFDKAPVKLFKRHSSIVFIGQAPLTMAVKMDFKKWINKINGVFLK